MQTFSWISSVPTQRVLRHTRSTAGSDDRGRILICSACFMAPQCTISTFVSILMGHGTTLMNEENEIHVLLFNFNVKVLCQNQKQAANCRLNKLLRISIWVSKRKLRKKKLQDPTATCQYFDGVKYFSDISL